MHLRYISDIRFDFYCFSGTERVNSIFRFLDSLLAASLILNTLLFVTEYTKLLKNQRSYDSKNTSVYKVAATGGGGRRNAIEKIQDQQ